MKVEPFYRPGVVSY